MREIPVEQQLVELREAVLAMALALGAGLPETPEVVRSLNALVDTAALKCKHCGLRIEITAGSRDWVHAEGDQQRKHTCAIDPYGFHAEPVGTRCGDHPANPCNGSRGLTPLTRAART